MEAMQLTATRFQRACTFFLAIVLPPSSIAAAWLLQPPAPLFVKLLVTVMMPLMVSGYGLLVARLTILPDGTLICSSLFRKTEINIADIRKIDIGLWNRGLAYVKTARGELVFWREMPGLRDALRRIAAENPEIKLKT